MGLILTMRCTIFSMKNFYVPLVLAGFASVLPCMLGGQESKVTAPILEARDIAGGCCDIHHDRTYLRVFADGRVEWDEIDFKTQRSVPHQSILSKKQLNAVRWAVDNLKGLDKIYTANYAQGNIDSMFSFRITASGSGRDYHTDISFGLPVSAENYAALPTRVRTVVCNIAIPRSQLAGEKTDLTFCKKYYVGW